MARLPGGDQVLAPVLDPFHRHAHLGRHQHQAHLVTLHHDLLPERAARVAHHDTDALFGQAEQARTEQANLVRRLRRGVDRQLPHGWRVVDDQAAALHRHRHIRVLVDRLSHDVGRRGEGLLESGHRGARHLPDQVRPVGFVDERRRFVRPGVVGDRRQRLVIDLHQLDGILREVAALGDHQRNRVANEAHPAFGEGWPRGLRTLPPDRGVPLLLDVAVEFRGREDGAHTRCCTRGRGVDVADLGVRDGAAHETGVEHPGKVDVVDIGAVPGQQPGILYPGHPPARIPRCPARHDIGNLHCPPSLRATPSGLEPP